MPTKAIPFICIALFLIPLDSFGAILTDPFPNNQYKYEDYFLYGEIKKGDFAKFLKLANKQNYRPGHLVISSPGGDVAEAIKFGKFANKMLMSCTADTQCNSSCFLILAGCADRRTAVDIGIHRPSFQPNEFGELPLSEAQKKYDAEIGLIDSYLQSMGIPKNIINIMTTISSGTVKFIPSADFEETIGRRAPAYYEWLKAKCGVIPEDEKEDAITAVEARFYDQSLEWHKLHKDAELTSASIESENRAKTYWDKAQQMPEGYRHYLLKEWDKIDSCENIAVMNEADKRWKSDQSRHNYK